MSRTGQHLVDIPEATVKVLADFPDFVLTYMRSQTEGGPGRQDPEIGPHRFLGWATGSHWLLV